jgi:hypothetical protein
MSDDDEKRLASGWGRRAPKPPDHDWSGRTDTEGEDEGGEDLEIAGDEGAISGRASSRKPQDIASGDTLGGPRQPETADDAGPTGEDEPPRR